MKYLILSFCAVCLCVGLPAVTNAQAKTSTPPAAESGAQNVAKVEAKYDKEKNETTVELQQLDIAGSQTQKVLLSVSASYAGQKPKQPPEDIIFIVSVISAQGYKYPDMMALQVTADGKKLPEVLMLNLDKRRLDEDYLETIGTRMKYEIFKRLTQAQAVELRLPNLTLQLNETQIAKLRELEGLLH
jgi:hypothetical protein